MIYGLILVFTVIGYYTFSYGLFILKKEKNKLAAAGTFLLAFTGTASPIITWFLLH